MMEMTFSLPSCHASVRADSSRGSDPRQLRYRAYAALVYTSEVTSNTESPPAWPAAAAGSLARQSVPLGGAIGVYGLMAAIQNSTLSLFLANAVHALPFLIGLFFTVRAGAGILAGLATGWVSDRLADRRMFFGLAGVSGMIGSLCLVVFHGYAVLIVTTTIFLSIGGGAYGPLFAYANELATVRGRDVTAFSSVMRSVFSGAYVVGAPLGLSVMARYGFGPLYLGLTGLAVAFAVIGRWALRPVPRTAHPITTKAPDEGGGVWRAMRGSLPARLWLLLGVVLVLGLVNQMYGIDISLHVTKDLRLSPALVGWMVGLTAAVEIPVMIAAGRAASRVGSGRLVGLSAVVATGSYCLMPLATGPAALLAVSALFGVWQGIALSIPMVMVQDETPGGLGFASSLQGAAFGAAGMLAGAVTGVTAAVVGYGGVLWVCAGLSAIAVLLMLARGAHRFRPTPP